MRIPRRIRSRSRKSLQRVRRSRTVVEFVVVLLTGILFARTFVAEAYVVPTGSMAPTLLGLHRTFDCPNCWYRVVLGTDEAGQVRDSGLSELRVEPGGLSRGRRYGRPAAGAEVLV